MSEAPRSKEHWIVVGGAFATLALLLAFAFLVEPDERGFGTHEKLGLQPCAPMRYWNVPCPGCGVTTSVTLASKGRIVDSFWNQPFGLLTFFLMGAFVLWVPLAHLRGRDLWRDAQSVRLGRWGAILGTLIVLAWVYKIWLVNR